MKQWMLIFLGLLLCGALAACKSSASAEHTGSAATTLQAQKAVIVDVRTPEEYARDHITGSTNVPIAQLESRIAEVVPDKGTPVMVHCQSGRRATTAAELLQSKGYTNVTNLRSLANARSVLESK